MPRVLLARPVALALGAAVLFGCGATPESPAGDAGIARRDGGAADAARPRDDAGPTDAGNGDALVAEAGLGDTGAADATLVDAGVPSPPAQLVRYLTGNAADRDVSPGGPGLVMMGGSREVDDAFRWWRALVAGGDVVILRTTGSDGYNDYLFTEIGGVDSVESLLVTSRALADDPYVAWRVRTAEGIFMAGGDQSTYIENWKGTAVEDALAAAWRRGAVLGGTSAGCAVLGQFSFAALGGSVTSPEVLADPFAADVTIERDFLNLPPLARVITDSHFRERDRMGRLIGFVGRIAAEGWADGTGTAGTVIGLGFDERTALVVDASGAGTVMGSGSVYVVTSTSAPDVARPGAALVHAVRVQRLGDGAQLQLPGAVSAAPVRDVRAADAQLVPADPY